MKPRLIGGALLLCAAAVLGWFFFANDGAGTGTEAGGNGRAAGGAGGPGGGAGGGGPDQETLVVTRPVAMAVTGDRLSAIGDGEAVASATVVPRDAGTLVEVAVTSGERVEAGDLLARLDSDLESVARDLAARDVADAAISQKRIARLVRSRAGAQADLDTADNALARAGIVLRDASIKLERRSILAPIAGTVGIVRVEPGNRVTVDDEIVTIDDRSTLLVDFRVPERFASRVAVGLRVKATSFADAGRQLDGEIVAVGSRVERDSRTLPVRASLDNPDDRLRPGMAFSMELRFPGDELPSVDPLAVRWDSSGSFVWQVVDGAAQRKPVHIVQRDTDAVLVRGDLAAGDDLVIEGLSSLREGAAVTRADAVAGGRGTKTAEDGGASGSSGT